MKNDLFSVYLPIYHSLCSLSMGKDPSTERFLLMSVVVQVFQWQILSTFVRLNFNITFILLALEFYVSCLFFFQLLKNVISFASGLHSF